MGLRILTEKPRFINNLYKAPTATQVCCKGCDHRQVALVESANLQPIVDMEVK
ncbi:9000_t:CDS:2, partial [Racocetra fulgida]